MTYGRDIKHIEVQCSVIQRTDRAWLIDNGHRQAWIPVSQISETDEGDDDEVISVFLPEWLASEKGLV